MVNFVRKVDDFVKIRRVIVSVSDSFELDLLMAGFLEVNPEVEIYATSGTYTRLTEPMGASANGRLFLISDYTGQPETQGGLVKTLDFKIYLGLLTETYNKAHQQDLERTAAKPVDMVVANLYPFVEATSLPNATCETARGNIDIGGPCMIRAAAKNYLRVAAVVDPSSYEELIFSLRTSGGSLSLQQRFVLAQKAFAYVAEYDRAIAAYLSEQPPERIDSLYDLMT